MVCVFSCVVPPAGALPDGAPPAGAPPETPGAGWGTVVSLWYSYTWVPRSEMGLTVPGAEVSPLYGFCFKRKTPTTSTTTTNTLTESTTQKIFCFSITILSGSGQAAQCGAPMRARCPNWAHYKYRPPSH